LCKFYGSKHGRSVRWLTCHAHAPGRWRSPSACLLFCLSILSSFTPMPCFAMDLSTSTASSSRVLDHALQPPSPPRVYHCSLHTVLCTTLHMYIIQISYSRNDRMLAEMCASSVSQTRIAPWQDETNISSCPGANGSKDALLFGKKKELTPGGAAS